MAETLSRFVGRSVKPHKTSRFLTGGGVYVSDIRLPNMLHAALLRSTRAHARIRSIDADYEELPVVADPNDALKVGATLVHDESKDNVVFSFSVNKGNIDQALRDASYTLRERFRHHRYCAAPLEGRGVVAWVEPKTNILTVWSSTQMPHLVRRQIAAQLSLPEETVRVIAPDIGGGFGPTGYVYPAELLVPFVSL